MKGCPYLNSMIIRNDQFLSLGSGLAGAKELS